MFQAHRWKHLLPKSLLFALLGLVLSVVFACNSPSGADKPQSSANAATAIPPGETLALGTNLAGVTEWATQFPFIDIFKSSSGWLTQCQAGEPGCKGGWETQERELLDLDEQGWVKSLPAVTDPPEYTRVGRLLFRNGGRYPGGTYVVRYDGEGAIAYQFDARKDEATSRPGRDVIQVTPSEGGILLQITATNPRNYIRNIRVMPIEYEQSSEVFNPLFLERTQPFQALRFMDWMHTNDSTQAEWRDRPQITDASYSTEKGVPLEIMIDLANRLGVSPWFNMPHRATDEYMTRFAELVKQRLNPNLKVYVELSNEVWNWQFQQAHYALEQGKARWGEHGDAFAQWYGMRAAQMSDIWNKVFADQPNRLVAVMATQTAWRGLAASALDCPLWVAEGHKPCYQHGFDVLAITGYFSGNLGQTQQRATVETWLKEPDGGIAKGLAQIAHANLLPIIDGFNDTLPGAVETFQYYAQVAREHRVQLVAYEGGQHLVSPDSESLTDYFITLNRHPGMERLYTQLLESWQAAGGTLFMHFSDIGAPTKWGSWGALEQLSQSRSPKYDALMTFIRRHRLSNR